DNAVSKTVNFPHDATREDVARVYMLAYEEGCKGITIYRDRSRESQVLSTREKDKTTKPEEAREAKLVPRDRPRTTWGFNEKVATGCGSLYVAVFLDERRELFEVFGTLGKAGGCASAQLEAINRLISLALRSGVEAESIIKQLKGIRCPSIAWDKGHAILSCADAIAGVLERYVSDGKAESNPKTETKGNPVAVGGLIRNLAGQCPDCACLLVYQEGCLLCPACGYTKC
ncbi:MAG TPA: TSCPD domain-containing protein, partial [Dehalococcoidia bacterium]|nr:TSCPD domain-containing protein [Dehalococcoidia bacterium]